MQKKWISMWANATSRGDRRAETYAKNITFRYPVFCPLNGEKLKFTFSNLCGEEEIRIDRAAVARSNGSREIFAETTRFLTVSGREAFTVSPGEELTSDELSFSVAKGEWIAVTFYLAGYTDCSSSVLVTGPLSKGFFAVGDYTESAHFPLNASRTTNWFYFLNRIDVYTRSDASGIICFGDSITAQAWPDYLQQKLRSEDVAVLRRAVCGTRILREYDCITYASYGIKGTTRFPREVGSIAGANAVFIQHGINDIIHPVGAEENPFRPWSDLPTAEDLIGGLKEYIACARGLGLKVYLGTLLPIFGWRTYAPFREELKNAVNDWIRTTDLADGVADFDMALRDGKNPAAFAQGFDSGDHLHPSSRAYERMAEVAAAALYQR